MKLYATCTDRSATHSPATITRRATKECGWKGLAKKWAGGVEAIQVQPRTKIRASSAIFAGHCAHTKHRDNADSWHKSQQGRGKGKIESGEGCEVWRAARPIVGSPRAASDKHFAYGKPCKLLSLALRKESTLFKQRRKRRRRLRLRQRKATAACSPKIASLVPPLCHILFCTLFLFRFSLSLSVAV